MKGIKEWINDMENNEELMKKFEGKESPEEIIALAKEEGYEFTVDDLMDLKMEAVSGGKKISLSKVWGVVSKIDLGRIGEKIGKGANTFFGGIKRGWHENNNN